MEEEIKKVIIAATFTVDFLAPSLAYYNRQLELGLSFEFVPYNQVLQQMIAPDSVMSNHSGFHCLLLRLADWLRFQEGASIQKGSLPVTEEDRRVLESSYETWVQAFRSFASRNQSQTLVLFCPSSPDGRYAAEWQQVFDEYRNRLNNVLQDFPAIKTLDCADFHDIYQFKGVVYDPIGDSMGHIPYQPDYIHLLGTLIIRYYYGLYIPGRKAIVVDCDNTIWNGICGEVGASGIDWEGNAGELQLFLANQCRQGMLICLCSKNMEKDVWDVFAARPDMPLQREHITAARINWESKSENIKALAAELNLGLDSFIFIDDNPIECSEVQINCPGVMVIPWPPPGDEPVRQLSQLWIFDHFTVTDEDRTRTRMYQAEINRRQAAEESKDWRQFIAGLMLEVDMEPVNPETIERVSQLTMRTNQFNFTTIRRTVGEIDTLKQAGNFGCYLARAQDRFGTYGIVGAIMFFTSKTIWTVDTFLLSCRVLGRGVEHRMIRWIAGEAARKGIRKIRLMFKESGRNLPAKQFLDWLGREYHGVADSESGLVFDTKKLLKCSYSRYGTTSIPESSKAKTTTKSKPVKEPHPENNMSLIDFWLQNRSVDRLAAEIDVFRKQSVTGPEYVSLENDASGNQVGKGSFSQKEVKRTPPVVETIAAVFAKYTTARPSDFTDDFQLETLALESQDIVSITSELNALFPGVPTTLLFECQTFGAVCERILGKKFAPDTPSGQSQYEGFPEDGSQPVLKAAPIVESHVSSGRDIAIIGISGRFPGAANVFEFWENLVAGKCSIREIPEERWDHHRFYSPEESDLCKSYSKWGGFIEGIEKFDAAFFKISPRQAALMDPQQRLLLQVVWNLIEDAGYHPERFEKKTGVFAGVISSDYGLYQNCLSLEGTATFRNCDYYQIPNRISYFFDFHGPSIAVDTACSASGTAVHLACESLLNKDSNCAIAAGVNLVIHPSRYIQYAHAGMLSRDNRCRPFGDDASGMIIGEGIGALLLKPYDRALQDGDHIWGVIKGSAVNSGGRTTGFTVPNPLAQSEVIRDALQKSGIDPQTISYIEAHGTGTALGDPIEFKGIETAYREETRINNGGKSFCAIGSVKSNIGHLESAAAIAGIIKVLLQMKFQTLVPSLHAETHNPKIDFDNSPFRIQREKSPWLRPVLETGGRAETLPLRAGVSSFGAGGSNAHIIIEEPAENQIIEANSTVPSAMDSPGEDHLILFSAQNETELKRYARRILDFLQKFVCSHRSRLPQYTLENIAYTLGTGRKFMEDRLAIVADSTPDLAAKLKLVLEGNVHQSGELDGMSLDQRTGLPWQEYPGIYIGRNNQNPELLNLFSGNAGQALIDTLVKENAMEKLAQFWVAGGCVPETVFGRKSKPRRVSLPGYPFDGDRYWMDELNKPSTIQLPAVLCASLKPQESMAVKGCSWFVFQKNWRKATEGHFQPEQAGGDNGISGDILIVGHHRSFITELLQYLEELRIPGSRILLITIDKDLPSMIDGSGVETCAIESYGFDQCRAALNQLSQENRSIGHVIHLNAFGPGENGGIEASFDTVFAIGRQLLKNRLTGPCQYLCIYPGNPEADDPYWGAISGLGKTMAEENPLLNFRSISIRLQWEVDDSAAARQFVDVLKRELFHNTPDVEIFYDGLNGLKKWCPDYQAIQEQYDSNLFSVPANLPREGGTYLITGGFGGIGMAIANYLASTGRCNIVLCGRTPLDEAKESKLKQFGTTGVVIDYFVADISQKQAVDQLIRNIRRQFGKINGIFHCAGIIRDSYVVKKEKNEFEAVLAPKVPGCIWLDEATRDEDLDFFMLCSSLSGVLGNAGQADYAYANHFLDSFSRYRNQMAARGERKGFTTAIAWPYWQNGGMKMSAADLEFFTGHTGLKPLTSGQGIEILKFVLSRKLESAIPGSGDPEIFSRALNRTSQAKSNGYPERKTMRPPGPEPAKITAMDDDQLNRLAKEWLQNVLGEVVQMNPRDIGEEHHFETLGIDSIAVRAFSHRIENKIGKVSRTLLYECQSLKDLTGYFIKNYRRQLQELFDRELRDQGNCEVAGHSPEQVRPVSFSTYEETASAREEQCPDIAIVGMSGCYPGAGDLAEYWDNLKNGRDCITRIPAERWDNRKYYHPDPKESSGGKYYCQWGGFMDSWAAFDPLFFNISPKEARAMDPQERLFLLLSWMALEDAGYNRDSLAALAPEGSQSRTGAPVGVFVGVTANDYQLMGAEMLGKADVIGRSLSWSIANRVSYCLNLSGPSLPVDGACSSSLMAIHLACESLRRGECEAAIAGAVHLNLHPFKYILNSQQRMLSVKGRCFAFSAMADGFVPGEGVGAFVLKRLDKALEHGDHIDAIIKGSAVNHGGRSNGYMVPNPEAQAEVIDKALRAARVNPRTISYLEAHGTGTILGDPIEIEGLAKVFRKTSRDSGYCSIGSVKANIGHAEAAAGIASLTKVILQMRHRWIVPALYADYPNPNIDFVETPFYLEPQGCKWERPVIREKDQTVEYPRRAGISSFGAGGSNAHIVVEEYEAPEPLDENPAPMDVIIVLSAMTEQQLREYARKLSVFLKTEFRESQAREGTSRMNLVNLAYTLQVGREELKERLAVVASTPEELVRKLEAFSGGLTTLAGVFHGTRVSNNHPGHSAVTWTVSGTGSMEIARLWAEDHKKIDWLSWYRDAGIHSLKRISLPTYPFSRRNYGIGPDPVKTEEPPKHKPGFMPVPETKNYELTGVMTRIDRQCYEFTIPLSLHDCEFLKAHILFGKAVLSGPTQLAMLFEAVYRGLGTIRLKIISMDFIKPIVVTYEVPLILKLSVGHYQNGVYRYQFQSRKVQDPDGPWELHSAGLLSLLGSIGPSPDETGEWPAAELEAMDVDAFYRKLEDMGYRFEDSFKCITGLKAADGFSASIIRDFTRKPDKPLPVMEPGIIDSCIQMLLPTLPGYVVAERPHSIYVPVYVGGFSLWGAFPEKMECYGRRIHWDDKKETLLGSIAMKDMHGQWLGKIDKFRLKRVDSGKLLK